ncbi:MAG: glyoxylate/hydroxypyruvate reductase A [Hyphomicrobiales bacterium]|nr:MAG: glyoxylate/hydroxypyruvate reductase A [Hyphomicrobiales bacterium]
MSLLFSISGWDVETWAAHFRRRAPQYDLQTGPFAEDPARVDYALVWKPPHGALKQLPNLKVIFSLGAGVDHILSDPELPDVPIVRVVDPDLTGRMTEWAVFHVLLHHRRHLMLAEAQTRHEWASFTQPAARDVRVGIMGLGVLGADAGQALARLGFQVAGWSRGKKAVEGVETFHGADGLGAFLVRTDILVSLLPLTPDTRGILNADLFKQLARDGAMPGPVLINAGRGETQREDDILAALANGTLHAASLDVFSTEPLPADHPLWDHPRVVISPHNAADSDPDRLSGYVLDQIASFEAGRGLTNVIDRTAGY